ncbi:hypothetical protein BCR44DRAFT_1116439 [Catenaria anguillulae PL171]|uniref:Uncharacterized protein n=1 Tax=Catenaria anguillulae PL171 TaxID=765915 RepID=A0A1Y2HM81_9FUNG|nr:hypothetical protein BCR44DRAFT_1116439 [Catenaria anguillulae PL171]
MSFPSRPAPPQHKNQFDRPNRPSQLNLVPKRSSSLSSSRKGSVSYLPSPPHTSTLATPTSCYLFPIDEHDTLADSGSESSSDSDSECTLFREVALDQGLRATLPFRDMPARPEDLSHSDLVRLTRMLYMDGMQLRRTVLQLGQQALYFKGQLDAAHVRQSNKQICRCGASKFLGANDEG